MSKFDAAISWLRLWAEGIDGIISGNIVFNNTPLNDTQKGHLTSSLDAAIRVLNAAAAVDERDLGRVFMGFVSTEMRALLEAIKEAK